MKTFYVPQRPRREVFQLDARKGGSELVKFDWSAWAAENGNVTSVTWTVLSGTASVGSSSLASNVGQAQVTTASEGWSLIRVTAVSGSDIDVQHLRVRAKDPQGEAQDYEP